MLRNLTALAAVAVASAFPTVGSAALLGTYEFTAMSLAATDADGGDGITLSDLSINSFDPGILNGDGDGDGTVDGNAIRIDGVTTANGSSSALSGGLYMSFTVTNNSGSTLFLESIAIDYKGTNIFQNFNTRVFDTTTPGSVVDDTITRIGRTGSGTDDAYVTDVGLLEGNDPAVGANFVGVPTTVADGDSLTLYLPWNMNSNSATRFMDIDNLRISSVPEPSSVLMLCAAMGFVAVRIRGDC